MSTLRKKTSKIMLLAVAGLLVTAISTGSVLYLLWQDGAFLPGWITWQNRHATDGSGTYGITLDKRTVEVRYQDSLIWTSPEKVKIQDILCYDIDNDGADELLLLCWKIGRYGKYRPFWVKEDEDTWSQHLFVYEFAGDSIRAQWMSSYMGIDVTGMAAGQMGAGKTRLLLVDRQEMVSYWYWDSWGFAKEETQVSFAVFGDNLIHEPIYR